MAPTFIGIGAPKAGTTWLANALAEHPEVGFSKDKEPDFFSYNYPTSSLADYEALFDHVGDCRAIGEFSTGYFIWEEAPERIRRDLPDVRLIAAFRDPVDQVYSHYWHLQRQNFHRWDASLGALTFEEALERFEDKLIGTARYADHLERWLDVFDRDRFCFVLFDDVKRDPEAVLSEVFAFVGVDPSWRPQSAGDTGSRARAGTSPRSAFAARWGARVYDGLNRAVYHPLKQVIGVERAAVWKDRLRAREVLEGLFRKKGYPPMASETHARLAAEFAEPNRRLGDLIGRDLEHWNAHLPG